MSIQAIQKYHNEIEAIKNFSGETKEQSIKISFLNLLNYYCRKRNLLTVSEVSIKNKKNEIIRPDGIIKNHSRFNCGYWESKANVNLEKEVSDKINSGYPLSNTLFQDANFAILYQDEKFVFKVSTEDYLEFEKNSEFKHEYFDGEIFAMVGARKNHNRVSSNTSSILWNQLKSTQCDVFISDMRVKIAEIDKNNYGQIWDPQPPLVGNKCLRHQFSCVVNSRGFVMPCVGVTIPVGNIREKKLAEILSESEIIQNLRNYRPLIKEPCQSCKKVDDCYGCRGAAYQLTGDYLASDPLCWHNIDKQHKIVTLPIEVKDVIPQKLSMRLIDRLTKVGERKVEAETVIHPDNIFLDGNGFLEETVFVELIAQTFAASHGFLTLGLPCAKVEGFLLGIKKLSISHNAKVGDHLKIIVFIVLFFSMTSGNSHFSMPILMVYSQFTYLLSKKYEIKT